MPVLCGAQARCGVVIGDGGKQGAVGEGRARVRAPLGSYTRCPMLLHSSYAIPASYPTIALRRVVLSARMPLGMLLHTR
eukprot:6960-Rhodomonas_salina.1